MRSFFKGRLTVFAGCLVLLALVTGLVLRNPAEQLSGTKKPTDFVKGVWISYYEYAEMINGKTREQYCEKVQEVVRDLCDLGTNHIFLHLRSHSDSFYPSNIFPWSKLINQGEGVPYDPLALFLQIAHQNQLQVHGWINPYRISSGRIEELSPDVPAYDMKEEDTCVVETATGVYYNPSSPVVRSLVLSGVRELLDRYELDGIQYDDYFYPTTDPAFDKSAYEGYCQGVASPMELADWRRCQVDLLIAGTYQLTQSYGVVFGVSPGADIEKNRDQLFADAAAWVAGGYVDYLCPQLYFGFEYPQEAFRYDGLLNRWKTLAKDTPLYIGLASYKVGKEDAGSDEWITATDLLARQHGLGVQAGADGICIYHYSSLMQQDQISITQRENLKKAWRS